jgi:multidrug efflux pump subunit AcrB
VLGRALRYPGTVVVAGVVVFVLSVLLLRALPGEFVPSQDQSRLMVRLQTAVGSSLEETNAIFHEAERVVYQNQDVDRGFAVVGAAAAAAPAPSMPA